MTLRILSLLGAGLLTLGTLSAHADETNDVTSEAAPYTCSLRGDIKGLSVAIGFGGELIGGQGVVRCKNNVSGKVTSQPVEIRLAGGGVGFDVSFINDIRVVSSNVSVRNPASLYGDFGIGATTGATLIRGGIEFDAAIHLSNRGAPGFDVALQGRDAIGLGAHLYAMTFSVARR